MCMTKLIGENVIQVLSLILCCRKVQTDTTHAFLSITVVTRVLKLQNPVLLCSTLPLEPLFFFPLCGLSDINNGI